MYRAATVTDWGQLCGLSSADLTEEQLNKLNFPKLIEFLPQDPRVEKIAGDKLLTVALKELGNIKNLTQEELKDKFYFKTKYNEALSIRNKEINDQTNYYYYRNQLVFWHLLNDDNKKEEIKQWATGSASVVDEYNIDYKWLYENGEKEIADQTVLKSLNKLSSYDYRNKDRIKNIVFNLPKEKYLAWLPEIFKRDKYSFVQTLTNPYTPKEYVITALRAASKMTHPPKVSVNITNEILLSLPPITRLEVIEKIVSQGRAKDDLPFTEIKTAEDLKQFLFSAITRHIDRVNIVVEQFKKLTENNNE